MKAKQLLVLVIVAAVLGGVAFLAQRARKRAVEPASVGGALLPDLPVNSVARMVFVSGTNAITVAKAGEKWVVPDRYNYPADFGKIVDTLRELAELKIGQTLKVSDSQLAALKLAPAAAAGTNEPSARDEGLKRIELLDMAGKPLAVLAVGKQFMRGPAAGRDDDMMGFGGGYPDGQYVKTQDGRVCLVDKTLEHMFRDSPKGWASDDFINVAATGVVEITVSGKGRDPLRLSRAKPEDAFALEGLKDDEELDKSKADRMAGALGYFGFEDIADPSLGDEATGMDAPVEFKARLQDGRVYEVLIGAQVSTNSQDRYARIRVGWEKPVEPAKEEKEGDKASGDQPEAKPAESEPDKDKKPAAADPADLARSANEKFKAWTYVMRSYRLEPMLFARSDVASKKKPPEPATNQVESATNQAESAVSAPAAAPATDAAPLAAESAAAAPADAAAKPAVAAQAASASEPAAAEDKNKPQLPAKFVVPGEKVPTESKPDADVAPDKAATNDVAAGETAGGGTDAN